jgi:N-acetylneuraminic acid mutarotase
MAVELGFAPARTTAQSRTAAAAMAPGWHALPDVPFAPIQDHAVATLESKVYVLGGFRTDAFAYDTRTQQWSRLAAVPAPMGIHHPNVAAVDGRIYVVGTLMRNGGPETEATSGAVWIYDPGSDAWTTGSTMPKPAKWRGASAVAAIGSKIYVAGGYKGRISGTPMPDFQVYDTALDTWQTLPDLPVARDHVMGASVGDIFYVIGGEDTDQVFDRVDIYDPAAGAWQAGTPMPTARAGAATGVIDGRIIVAGGDDENPGESQVFAATESYDPSTDSWTTLDPMPSPRQGIMGLSGTGGVLYVIGGGDVTGGSVTRTFTAFVPPTP